MRQEGDEGPRIVGQDESSRRVHVDPQPARRRLHGDRPEGHAGLHHADRERVGEGSARDEAPGVEAIDRELLEGVALRVGVEADLAGEGPVGGGDRARAQSADRETARAIVGVLEALHDDAGALVAPRDRHPGEVQAQAGEVVPHGVGDTRLQDPDAVVDHAAAG